MLDNAVHVETPEGVELALIPAGPVVRSLAFLFDAAIRLGMAMLALLGLAGLGELGIGLVLIAWFLLEWLYPVFFEVAMQGQTPGKRAFGIAVVRCDGGPVDWTAAMVRNLLRSVDFLPVFYGVAFTTMLLTSRLQRLGDLAADTMVVYRHQSAVDVLVLPEVSPHPPVVVLQANEVQAILAYAERVQTLSAERAQELAELVPEVTTAEQVTPLQLYAIANWLMGRRATH